MLLPISRQFLKSAHSAPKRQVLGQIGARSRDVRRAILAHSPCIASAFACQTRSLNGRTSGSATAMMQACYERDGVKKVEPLLPE